ncbi:MAG: NTP transferase domain-containing protein [Streptosporangiaceae bacterium]
MREPLVAGRDTAHDERLVRCAVVLAAGRGLRMRSDQPKVLRRVGGVSLLERAVHVLRSAGVDRVAVVVGYRGESVVKAVRAKGLPVEVVYNPEWERGTATSVVAGVRAAVGERCLVVMGDHVFEADDVERLLASPGHTVVALDRDPERQFGGLAGARATRMRVGRDGRVLTLGDHLDDYDGVDAGLAVVNIKDLLALASTSAEASWDDLRRSLIARGCEIRACEVGGLWADIDTPESIRALERALWRRYGPKPTDGIIARVVNRRISGPLTRLLLRTGITPDTATYLAFALTAAAAGLVATGQRPLLIVGGLAILLGSALDGVDGELARVSGRASRRGAVLDTLLDRYADLGVVVGLVLAAGGTSFAWTWGFVTGAGCLLVSYVHAVGRDTDVRLLLRREFRLLIFAVAAVTGLPLWGLIVVGVAANLDVVRGVVLLLRATRS